MPRRTTRGASTALFSVNEIVAEIKKQLIEDNKKRVAERVAVMLKSQAKRELNAAKEEVETEHYETRVQKMLDGLAEVHDAASLEAWFAKGY